jgi:ABC-type molybdate transport system substrate-binding protein
MLKYAINDFLELKLEDEKTNIYVDNELFIQCKYLLVNISMNDYKELNEINSIDEIIDKLENSFEFSNKNSIPSGIQFWGHCSSLQAWYENNYDCSILDSKLAFPLLRKLAVAGDILANRVFKEEIAIRLETGYLSTVRFLLFNGYLSFLDKEELDCVFTQSSLSIVENFIEELQTLMISPLDNFRAINELLDLVLFIDLKFNQNILIEIFKNLPQTMIVGFIKSAILHLNYKEFRDYLVPYGKFYTYSESILDFLYTYYSHCGDLLKLLDSGFFNSPLSIEERYSYGTFF